LVKYTGLSTREIAEYSAESQVEELNVKLAKRKDVRSTLIEVAVELMNEFGIHETGIDLIIERAGVAKRSFYNHFTSKENLILAALEYYDTKFQQWLITNLPLHSGKPAVQILRLFDIGERWFRDSKFHGCLFIGAAREFPDPSSDIRNFCRSAKERFRKYIEKLLKEGNYQHCKLLSSQIVMLFEGATVMALVNGSSSTAKQARDVAALLIKTAQCKAKSK
jgi:AcrR family transcriptional regulator